jgi:hypothetical protein
VTKVVKVMEEINMRVSMGSLVLVEKITKSVAEQALTHPDIEEQTDTDKVGDEG